MNQCGSSPEHERPTEENGLQDTRDVDPEVGPDVDNETEEGLTAVTSLMTGESVANGKPNDPGGKADDSRFKIDIYIRKHGVRGHRSGSVKRFRTDARRCCLFLCLLFVIIAVTLSAVLIYVYINDSDTSRKPVKVTTQYGVIEGRQVHSPHGVLLEEYLGIPYAEPPVGILRYADPVPYGNFTNGTYIADSVQNSCVMPLDLTYGNFSGSAMWNAPNPRKEDCLFLNIWVPLPRKQKRAVMVWIYGGGFFSGSNALWVYDGKALASFGDVIVASFNYRVGTFGYLSTGDGRIKGNFGMKDQVLALQWIKDNIAAFGGDPELITLFGESSGASSAALHMMSGMSQHLFKRAIFESGSPDAHWSFMTQEQAMSRSKAFFDAVNCEDNDRILECLRALDETEILNNEWVTGEFMVFPWAPSIDGVFLTASPHDLLEQAVTERQLPASSGQRRVLDTMKHKEALLGVNSDEGTYWILYALDVLRRESESLVSYDQFTDAIETLDWDLNDQNQRRVIEMYSPKNHSNTAANRDNLDKVCGDRSFTCPTKDLARRYAEQGITTYFYYLTHRASNEVWPPWMGVIHGAEIQWIFGMPLNESRGYTEEEVALSKTIMSYWVNFAKTGNPNGKDLPEWPKYLLPDPEYIEIRSPDKFLLRTGLRDDYCDMWDEINARLAAGLDV